MNSEFYKSVCRQQTGNLKNLVLPVRSLREPGSTPLVTTSDVYGGGGAGGRVG